MTPTRIGLLFGALLLALPLAGTASSQSPPASDEIVRKLQPSPATRSLRRGIRVDEGQKHEQPPSIDLYINFEFDSDRMTTDAQIVLGNLALALLDPRLAHYRFVIAGHTDAVGGDAYNLELSRRRAESVKLSLIRKYGIDPLRLKAVGHGKAKLLDPGNPTSGVNRRVQIINQGESS